MNSIISSENHTLSMKHLGLCAALLFLFTMSSCTLLTYYSGQSIPPAGEPSFKTCHCENDFAPRSDSITFTKRWASPQRSDSVVRAFYNREKADIAKYLEKHDTLFKGRDTLRFSIDVLPDGRLQCPFTSGDTTIKDGILTGRRLNPLSANNAIVRIRGMAKRDASTSRVAMPDSVRMQLVEWRSKASIQKVVMCHMRDLRYAYTSELRDNPELTGKIMYKFAIDEWGTVFFCDVVNTTMHAPYLENELQKQIKAWRFESIYSPGDTTEVTYPFVFNP